MAFSKPNHLANESSPYLKLHAEQPVDWYPWGEEAMDKAKKENKPILISIGYSTCHWCHVMARESFEDQEIADYLNEHFVSIKLDREERPDIDQIYMTAHQAMHEGSGGWPLNVFLTPDLKPFFSGTYFPPKAKASRPGFDQVIRGVNEAWEKKREQVTEFSENLTTQLQAEAPSDASTADLGKNFIPHTTGMILARGDQEHFGWGGGPKFPQSALLRLLLLSEKEEEQKFSLNSLRRMAESGLYDHINGGFHRYCVDREWIVPHFEKMLYDQAQLIEAYLDAYLATTDQFYADIAAETCDYLLREMRADNGAFYAAQDAQSEGKEGKFSCWTLAELATKFSETEVKLLQQHFDLTEEGNFFDFSDPEALTNQNVLVVIKSLNMFNDEEQKQLTKLKGQLFALREKRTPPATDTKILLNWNALAISALARAGHILDSPHYLEAGKGAYRSLVSTHQSDGVLYHSSKDGQKHGKNLGADYASMIYAARTLYHSTLEADYLQDALRYTNTTLELFYDAENGGFFETSKDSKLVMRLKSEFDNALPAVSSQMVRELSILSEITDAPAYREALENTLKHHQAALQTAPINLGEMLLALAQTQQTRTLALVEKSSADDTTSESAAPFISAAFQSLPTPLVIGNAEPILKFYRELPATEEPGVRAYLCEEKTCKVPTSDLGELKQQLKGWE